MVDCSVSGSASIGNFTNGSTLHRIKKINGIPQPNPWNTFQTDQVKGNDTSNRLEKPHNRVGFIFVQKIRKRA